VPYFHVVFTLPLPAAEIAFQNKRVVYAILFRAAAEAMRDVAADPRHLGAESGAVAVLHSWGQAMTYHPHLHCIVPAGGLSPDQTRWVACRMPKPNVSNGHRLPRPSSDVSLLSSPACVS
jgi:hypothetical protein